MTIYPDTLHKNSKTYSANRDKDKPDTEQITDRYEGASRDEMSDLSLPGSFFEEFPDMNPDRVHKYHARYLRVIARELIKRSKFKRGLGIQFGLKTAIDNCGSFNYNNKKHYIWTVFNRIHPIITVIDKGNNMKKQVTSAIISDQYYDLLISSADATEIMKLWFADATHSEFKLVPVDMTSLEHFIASTEESIDAGGRPAYISGLKRNLRHAKMIQVVANHMVDSGVSDTPVWVHQHKMSEYGRRYYHGLSVQSVHRELRRAALGGYYQYDLNAAVYAIKLMIVEKIYKDMDVDMRGQYSHTEDYLDLKKGIRKQLARHIKNYPDGERLVKQAITAIGFGAKLQSAAWTDENNEQQLGAITDIIKNEEDRNRFMNDPWVKAFVKEQEVMTNVIYESWIRDEAFKQKMMTVPNSLSPSGRLKKSAVVAYLFQHREREIIEEVFGDMDYTMDIHDAVVSVEKLDLLEIRTRLQGISKWLKIEEEYKSGYYSQRFDADLQAHKAFIDQEERDAAKHYGTHTKPTRVWRDSVKQHDGNTSAYTGSSNEVEATWLWQ